MTRAANARLAGFTFLFYIAAGISSLALPRAAAARDVALLLTSFSALVLGVTLYAITRDEDPDLAMIAMACRVIEAIPDGRGAVFFAVGSTLFCWLFVRGRMIPIALAWFGFVASIALVLILFLQHAGAFAIATNWYSSVTWVVWFPMLIFELTLAFWLIVRGVTPPQRALPVSQ